METIFEVTAESTPFRGDVAGSGAFYEALGRTSCLWGRFETNFAIILISLVNLPEAGSIRRPFPVPWKQKAKLWRDAFSTLPSLATWRTRASEFIADANSVANDRHFLQHSAFWEFKSAEPLEADFRRLRFKRANCA